MALFEYEVKDRICHLRLNRAEKLNALNWEMASEILSCCKRYEKDRNVWAAVISGKGKAFSGGGDTESSELFDKLDRFF